MIETYERTKLIITEFDAEDVIITSGEVTPPTPEEPTNPVRLLEKENVYRSFGSFDAPGSWF